MLYSEVVLKRQSHRKEGGNTNADLLKSVLVKNGDTQAKLAEFLGLSLSALNAKIHGKRSSFRQNEIMAIKARYNLNADEIDEIFFTSNLS